MGKDAESRLLSPPVPTGASRRCWASEIKSLSALMLGLTLAAPCHSGLIRFDLSYTGLDNPATGTGYVVLDDTILPNPGLVTGTAGSVGVVDISLTISGASSGNGTFGLADFESYSWRADPAVNLDAELLDQAGFRDWNVFAVSGSDAPTGNIHNHITTAEGGGSELYLTSMVPVAVPEPTALLWVMFGAGILLRLRTGRAVGGSKAARRAAVGHIVSDAGHESRDSTFGCTHIADEFVGRSPGNS